MTLEDVKRECYLFRQDTTAGLISSLIHHILQNSKVNSKLRHETETFEQQGRLLHPVVQYDETTQMPFFVACVRESLRVSPPTPIILPRYVSSGGMMVDGIWVPGKTEIAANSYIIHRSERIFGEEPDESRPERWFVSSKLQLLQMDKYDFSPESKVSWEESCFD